MDRKAFKRTFGKCGVTHFLCPICAKGSLKIQDGTLQFDETRASERARNHEAWDPEWIDYVYSCIFECTNLDCKDVVSSVGYGGVEYSYYYDENGETDVDYNEYFRPKYFFPSLKLFETPKATPETVCEEIEISFSLIFSDPASSANHIRIALENLLTHLKIKRFNTSGGKRKYLPLHQRIDLLPTKFDHVKDLFYAVKWLGNAGSHSAQSITVDDVFDSYEILEEILKEVFDNRKAEVKKIASRVNKKKGPR